MTWYLDEGPESDIIISSRVRLARNVNQYPFPHRMNHEQAKKAADEIVQAFYRDDNQRKKHFLMVDLDTLPDEDRRSLAEKRLISDDLAQKGQNHRVLISRDESLSIMINEEDHIRIQSMQAGLDLESAFQSGARIAAMLEETLPIAYRDKYGYLTACPTNTGTGMRASVMAHLPGMVMNGRIKDAIDSLIKLGFAVRGTYGEHSKSSGNLFQISNQLTLGISEDDLINDLSRMLQQLIEQERGIRRALYQNQPLAIEDKVMRAYGLLTQARLMTTDEATGLISDLRLGLSLGLIQSMTLTDVNRMAASIGPASIQKARGRAMSTEERDCARAEIIRELMKKPTDQSNG
jgi:protein arginine kinase